MYLAGAVLMVAFGIALVMAGRQAVLIARAAWLRRPSQWRLVEVPVKTALGDRRFINLWAKSGSKWLKLGSVEVTADDFEDRIAEARAVAEGKIAALNQTRNKK